MPRRRFERAHGNRIVQRLASGRVCDPPLICSSTQWWEAGHIPAPPPGGKLRGVIRAKFLLALTSAIGGSLLSAQHQILPDFQADPSARVFHGRVYVYPSHDVAGSKDWDMKDWHVFSTDDMVHWKDHGQIFSLADIHWATRYAWAPDCIERNGKCYFYFPADDQIGVAVGD